MVTKEFVAIHRKHHAKVETDEDPHSPQTRGLKKLLLEGTELYRAESKNMETMAKYGYGTPDDWIERNLYTRYSWQGVGLMVIIDVALFGAGRPGRLGGADGLDSRHGHGRDQRHWPLLGLSQLSKSAGRQHQCEHLGHHHWRRRAAQQPPHLPDIGTVLGQAL
jgi:hypothetical protein